MKAHCLFEQSGTFKNEFKKLGIEAYDYDLMNDFNETDFQVDLFAEIVGGVQGKPSIFDNMSKDDLILAFFPCIRFENQIMLFFRGQEFKKKDWTLCLKMWCTAIGLCRKYRQDCLKMWISSASIGKTAAYF